MWGAGDGGSEFYPWADWRWLVEYAEPRVTATPSGGKCQRVLEYEPAHVGVVRLLLGGPTAGEPTHWYTVVTLPDGTFWTTYPGTLDE